LFGAIAKPASITLRKLVLSPTGSINLGFILREDLLLCSSYLPLGVPNWVSGYLFTLGGGVVSWKSCKQTILTRSTMEAELTALDTTTIEAEWLQELLMDLPVVEKPIPVIPMNYDNQTVIIKLNSSKDNMKSSRHVKRRLKSVRKMRNS
jgi:hypothetical protein